MACFPLFNVFYESDVYASKWFLKSTNVCGNGRHALWSPQQSSVGAIPPPPALSNVGKYADGTIKWFTISQIYNKIAFSLYSSLLSIRYFELGNLEREEREKRGLDRNQARIQRGDRGSGPPPPPWDLTEVRSCVAAWWVHVGEGVQRLFSTYYYLFFWLASLASIIQVYVLHIYILPSSIFSMERSSFLYTSVSLIQIMKRIQLPIPCFMKRHSCPELHDFTPFKTHIFWERNPPPHPPTHHIIKLPRCHLYVCVERRFQLYKRPCPTENKLVCR